MARRDYLNNPSKEFIICCHRFCYWCLFNFFCVASKSQGLVIVLPQFHLIHHHIVVGCKIVDSLLVELIKFFPQFDIPLFF